MDERKYQPFNGHNCARAEVIDTRVKARAFRRTRYRTGKPCKAGHIADRQTSSGQCVTCAAERSAKWQRENPEKKAEAAKRRALAQYIARGRQMDRRASRQA
jgi:hypothetical protein